MGILGCGVGVFFFFPLVMLSFFLLFWLIVGLVFLFVCLFLLGFLFVLVFVFLINLGYIKEASYFSRICLG